MYFGIFYLNALNMRALFILFFAVFISGSLFSQGFAIKNNFVYDATLTPNLSLELGIGKKTTLDLGFGYNPFEFGSGRRWKHWLAQPEFRYWFCERFNGSFLGVHALGGEYSFSRIDFPFNVFDDLKDYRYEGWYAGGGFTFGYQWILSRHWSIEAALGVGYARVYYDQYRCAACAAKVGDGYKNYFGPTKAALSLVFFK
jgi:hypothetical protein